MTTKTKAHIHRAYQRVKRAWSEIDHAQRRLLELRTGLELVDPKRPSSRARDTIDRLERLYALEYPSRKES